MDNILMQIAQGAGQQGKPPISYPLNPYYFPSISTGSQSGHMPNQ